MEKTHLFLNAGIHPLEPNPSLSIPIQMQPNNNDCLFPTWEKSTDQGLHFDSALSSLVSSPAASNSNISNENISIREIIAKLGDIGGVISPHYKQMLATSYNTASPGNSNTNITKLNLRHLMDQYNRELVNFPGPGSESSVAELMADPGFVERAARFSCFGSGSFNAELGYNVMGSSSSSKVSSSSALEVSGFRMGKKGCDGSEPGNSSQEESTVSDHLSFPNGGEANWKASCERNSRKRKAASGGKANDPPANVLKDAEIKDNSDAKRRKPNQGNGNENSSAKAEEDNSEPPKDYIHVRARRGQATDSHSLAERVRREKISERMKLLQDLVPGCSKVTGKALMLDEIINYVQSLQRQVEFLAMKLASANPRLDFDIDTFTSKEIFQSNPQLQQFPLDSSASAIFDHQPLQNQLLHSNISNGIVTQCPVDPLGTGLCHNPNSMLPQLDSFISSTPQDDLQTIVQMGFGRTPDREMTLQSQNFHGSNPHTKVEL